MKNVSLKRSVAGLEDAIIVISGPALAISGIIAGVDLVTGGHLLTQVGWLTLAWAITLLLTLDFQVLALGVRGMRVYQSNKSPARKVVEVLLIVFIAAAISFVSIQMQSIIARVNAEGISIDTAAVQLGVNMVALTWERSTLVLVLIFLSGWLREADQRIPITGNNPSQQHLAAALQTVAISQSSEDNTPVQIPQIARSRFESKEQAIWTALAQNPHASDEELAQAANTTVRTANKWASKIRRASVS